MGAVVREGAYRMFETAYQWKHPKTNWTIVYDESGNYTGDYFEPEDYNRIKNNVNYLRDYAEYLFLCNPEFADLGEDVYYGSPNELTASWWKKLQDNLEHISNDTLQFSLGEKNIYSSNEAGRLLEELIRVETVCLKIYETLSGIEKNKAKLSFRLGNGLKGVKC